MDGGMGCFEFPLKDCRRRMRRRRQRRRRMRPNSNYHIKADADD